MRLLPKIPVRLPSFSIPVRLPRLSLGLSPARRRFLSGVGWLLLGFVCVSLLPGSLPRVLDVRGEPGLFASGLSGIQDAEEARHPELPAFPAHALRQQQPV